MAKASLLFFTLFIIAAAGRFSGANAQDQKRWCVANPSADEKVLSKNIDFACAQAGVDCSPIADGGPCHFPDTVPNHASVAMNLYYQVYAPKLGDAACFFAGTGLITITDPSYSDCKYA